MNVPYRPPRWVERIVFLGTKAGDDLLFLLGDLREEYAERRATQSAFFAGCWFAREAISIRIRMTRSQFGEQPSTSPPSPNPHAPPSSPPLHRVRAMLAEFRLSLRSVLRRPGFALLVAATMGTGVAASTVMSAALRSVVFTPLAWEQPERVYAIETRISNLDWMGSSGPEFIDLRDGLSSFEALGGYGYTIGTLGDSTSPRRVTMALVTAQVLPLLGAQPLMGRWFTEEEARPGSPRVAILSHAAWRRDFAGRESPLGSTIHLGETPYAVIGVMPAAFDFPDPDVAAWIPWRLTLDEQPGGRANHFLSVIGRLSSTATPEAARAELRTLTNRLIETYPSDYSGGYDLRMRPYLDRVVGDVRRPLWLLAIAAVLLLTLATVNVSMLLAGRHVSRAHETAVRAALGSGSIRAAAPFVVEAWLGIIAGGLVGIATAGMILRGGRMVASAWLPRSDVLRMTPSILFASVAAILIAGVVATFFALTRSRVTEPLRASGRAVAADQVTGYSSNVLVVTQMAMAVALCIGAGLMVRSVDSLYRVDPGVNAVGVLTARTTPRGEKYREAEARIAFYDQLQTRLQALPGVSAAGAALNVPYAATRYNSDWTFQRPADQDASVGDSPVATVQMVSPGYFAAAGLRVRGRPFASFDRADAPPVVIINETMARRFWPDEDPIGRRMRVFNTPNPKPWMQIVGVVADVHSFGLDRAAPPIYYLPTTQSHVTTFFTPSEMTVFVRVSGDPIYLAADVRVVVSDVDPATAISDVRSLEGVLQSSLDQRTVTLRVLAVFGIVALALAGVGVWALMIATVQSRRPEIGIRRALGERATSVAFRLLRQVLGLVCVGTAIGIATAVSGARLISSLLYGVSVWDPATLLSVTGVLAFTALTAATLPTVIAVNVRPMEILRADL